MSSGDKKGFQFGVYVYANEDQTWGYITIPNCSNLPPVGGLR